MATPFLNGLQTNAFRLVGTTPAGYVLTTDGSGNGTYQPTGADIRTITQTSHGFTVGQNIRYNGTTYVLSQADASANADVEGMVSLVIDANTFILTLDGYVTGLSGLTAGTDYFLSAASAGALTATAPSTAGQVNYFLFKSDSTTSGYFRNYRGTTIAASSGGTGITWSVITTATTAAVSTGYIANNTTRVVLTLPSTAAVGSIIEVTNIGSGGFQVAQAAGVQIRFGYTATTSGTGGSLASTQLGDSLRLLCTVANTSWSVLSSVGSLTVV